MQKVTTYILLLTLHFVIQLNVIRANQGCRTEAGIAIQGTAPSLAAEDVMIYLVFANGDSIQFSYSNDKGKSFSPAVTAGIIPKLASGGGRGPKIVIAGQKLVIAVADANGNIFSFVKDKSGIAWEKGSQVNDVNDVAKEGFVALSANAKGEVFAVWLDLRNNQKNKIAGAKTLDGGKSWSVNQIIYTSPEGTVCECCKPSVAMHDQMVVVMFRNSLKGNRDMYILQSTNGGKDFGKARKIGVGSWQLNACPMDGGGLIIGENSTIQTIWRREGSIYSCEAGKQEELLTTGKQCVIVGKEGKNFIAFVNDGNIYCRLPNQQIIELGKGSRPELASLDTSSALCAWEDKGRLYYRLL